MTPPSPSTITPSTEKRRLITVSPSILMDVYARRSGCWMPSTRWSRGLTRKDTLMAQLVRPRSSNGRLVPIPILDRFWINVRKTDGCWLWTGAHKPSGYGDIWYRNRPQIAHRVSWQIYHGAIPKELHVLHSCDIPSCVNPAHLFLGTAKDNAADCIRKGRFVFHRPPMKDVCKRGHKYIGDNIRIRQYKGRIYRVCRSCSNILKKRDRQVRRACRQGGAT